MFLTVSKMSYDKPVFRKVDVNASIIKVIQMLSLKYKDFKIVSHFNSHFASSMV